MTKADFLSKIEPCEGVWEWFHFLAAQDRRANLNATNREYGFETFPYIMYPIGNFDALISSLLDAKSVKSFFDIGCGGGDKLAWVKVKYPHIRAVGVEHTPAMAIWARLFGDEVFCCDAFDIDYSKYDVIYGYWPIKNRQLMGELIKKILDEKKKRAKFVLTGFYDPDCGDLFAKAKRLDSGFVWT